MRFIDLFAGIGGFRRGMELAGHGCIGFCVYDDFASASYTSMHLATEEQREYLKNMDKLKRRKEILKEEYRNGEWYAKDIKELTGYGLPEAECWCFGAPCQSFSIAGKRAGLDGESGLVREVFRLLREKREEDRPEWLVYENVRGMLSSNRGFDYLAILTELDDLGYDAEWLLCNSKNYGIPQNRERVYTVGHLRRCGGREVFPVERADGENSVPINQIGHRPSRNRENPQSYRIFDISGLSPCLNALSGGGHKPCIAVPALPATGEGGSARVEVVCNRKPPGESSFRQRECVWGARGLSGCLTAAEHKDPHRVAIPIKNVTKQGNLMAHEGDSINDSFLSRDRVGVQAAQTKMLDTACNQGKFVQVTDELTVYAIWYQQYHSYIAIRKLTPKECFRLQGWSWKCGDDRYFERAAFINSDSQLYKQSGNGVTVPVVEAVAERIK